MSRTEIARTLIASIVLGQLLLIATAARLHSSDVPDWVLRGIASVETSSDWRDIDDITYRDRRIGEAGEVGPWQLSPDALRDLKAYNKRARIHRNVVLAESMTRAWLLRLYRVTGSWPDAVAAYHAGLGNRTEDYAIAYAKDVAAAGGAQ